uniref:Symplekin n=1 Tax=Romanomermis culicivorax TaxID=13658 RepID=A0A915KJJ5_ROMCU
MNCDLDKQDPDVLPKVVVNLSDFINSDNVNIRKKVIQSMTSLYPVALKWIAKMYNISGPVTQAWEKYLEPMKNRLTILLDDDNDGIRTYAIKFIESVTIAQSNKSSFAKLKEKEDATMSLDEVPRTHKLLSYRKLEAEGKIFFEKLLTLLASQHVSSVNLMACMTSLSNVARLRPDFMEKTILAYEALHVNLPPTLAKSQVSSVRKILKNNLLSLLKHPASMPFQPQMTTLLTDLGATQVQVLKALPPGSDLRKRIKRVEADNCESHDGASSKRQKTDGDESDNVAGVSGATAGVEDDDDEAGQETDQIEERRLNNAIDVTAEYLYKKLTPQNVADLVLLSMIVLPDSMPPQFQSSFTPIAAAGTEAQIRHLSRLMSTQFTALGVGPGAEQQAKRRKEIELQKSAQFLEKISGIGQKKSDDVKPMEAIVNSAIVTSSSFPVDGQAQNKPTIATPLPNVKTSKRFHQFGLAHITKPMDPETTQKMTIMAFERILNAEKRVINGGASLSHMKILIAIVSEFNNPILSKKSFILSDQKSRSDLAILWVYFEFSRYQKANQDLIIAEQQESSVTDFDLQTSVKARDQTYEKYDRCLSTLLSTLMERGEHKESLFHKILLEAPLVTPNSLHILQRACLDPLHGSLALITLREMIMTRPKQRNEILSVLIDFTCFEKADLRHQSLEIAKELYKLPQTRICVYKYIEEFLETLVLPSPTNNLFGANKGRLENPGRWEEDSIKACLYLFLFLLPVDYSLIHKLADVYVQTANETKRVILRLIETPIKANGFQSPELLSLIDNFPKGSETLVTKVVNLLTERNPPTLELVQKVRTLYQERVSDVRFLIPREIVAALPKLIRLNSGVVKEVFNRLLHGKNLETGQQSLSPSKLLIALGQMEFTSSEEAKPILVAVDMLLNDRFVYTKEVLATVVQTLAENSPLPTQLMRIVIRSLSFYPSLVGFVINIMQRLITKKVWTQPKVWQGFIKCCLKTRPQSFAVLMQLKTPQLENIFSIAPELKTALINHTSSLGAHQPIPPDVVRALRTESEETNAASDTEVAAVQTIGSLSTENDDSQTASTTVAESDLNQDTTSSS